MSGDPLSSEIRNYILDLVKRHPTVETIWLIGSRANGAESLQSDWDFVVFRGDPLFENLAEDNSAHRTDVDLLVVLDDGDSLQRPWGRRKRGSLADWKWIQKTDDVASYVGAKWFPDEEQVAKGRDMGEVQHTKLNALRVWP